MSKQRANQHVCDLIQLGQAREEGWHTRLAGDFAVVFVMGRLALFFDFLSFVRAGFDRTVRPDLLHRRQCHFSRCHFPGLQITIFNTT